MKRVYREDLVKNQPVILVEHDYGYGDEEENGIYVGYNLSTKYPKSLHFYVWVSSANLWERHAYDIDVDMQEPSGYEEKDFVRFIFSANEWVVST